MVILFLSKNIYIFSNQNLSRGSGFRHSIVKAALWWTSTPFLIILLAFANKKIKKGVGVHKAAFAIQAESIIIDPWILKNYERLSLESLPTFFMELNDIFVIGPPQWS